MSQPVEPTPATAPEPVPAPSAGPLTRAVHWAEQHLVPGLKEVEANAGKILATAENLAAIAEKADPALAAEIGPAVAVLREIAEALAVL